MTVLTTPILNPRQAALKGISVENTEKTAEITRLWPSCSLFLLISRETCLSFHGNGGGALTAQAWGTSAASSLKKSDGYRPVWENFPLWADAAAEIPVLEKMPALAPEGIFA